jgi:hypothetical protein
MKARYLVLEFITTMQEIQMVKAEHKLEIKEYNSFMFIPMRHSLQAKSEFGII